MVNDQIKKEIEKEVDKRLKESLSIFSLPLISKYKVLLFSGIADGSNLLNQFNINDVLGKILVIKSIKVYPYANGGNLDFWFFDGVTNTIETIPSVSKIQRLFDRYFAGETTFRFTINGGIVSLFGELVDVGYPLDLNIDNIFYKYPEKVSSINFSVNTRVVNDIQANTTNQPFVKVVVECYLL